MKGIGALLLGTLVACCGIFAACDGPYFLRNVNMSVKEGDRLEAEREAAATRQAATLPDNASEPAKRP